jgi:hypothetical protein
MYLCVLRGPCAVSDLVSTQKALILASGSLYGILSSVFLVFYTFILPYTLVVTYMYFSVLYSVHLRMAHVGRNM